MTSVEYTEDLRVLIPGPHIPIRGEPLVPGPPDADWKAELEQRFSQPLLERIRGVLRAWLRQFSQCPQGAPHEVVRTHLIAYIL